MEIIRGKIPCAKKVVIYGPEGIGKSTFASRFPDPVFIDTEGSTNSMDLARFPKPTSWQMILDEVEYARSHPNEMKTLVIDTVDWAESLCIKNICDKHQKSGSYCENAGGGSASVRGAPKAPRGCEAGHDHCGAGRLRGTADPQESCHTFLPAL